MAFKTFTFAAAFAAGLGFASFAQAQTQTETPDLSNNTAFGGWIVKCEALSVKRSVCRLTQELTLRESGDLVVRLVAMPVSDGALLFAQVPIGVYLPGGAVYRPKDDEAAEQRELVWQRCLGGVCEAATGLDTAELEKLKTTQSVLFGYRMDAEGQPIVVEVDTARFVEALDALRAQLPKEEPTAADAAKKTDAAKKN